MKDHYFAWIDTYKGRVGQDVSSKKLKIPKKGILFYSILIKVYNVTFSIFKVDTELHNPSYKQQTCDPFFPVLRKTLRHVSFLI